MVISQRLGNSVGNKVLLAAEKQDVTVFMELPLLLMN